MILWLKKVGSGGWFAWLAVIYPIAFLFERNMALVYAEDFFIALSVALFAVTLIWAAAWLTTHSLYRAYMIAAWIAVLFFSAGHVYILAASNSNLQTFLPNLVLTIWIALAVLGVAAIIRFLTDDLIRRVSPTLNVILLVMMLFPAVRAIQFFAAKQGRPQVVKTDAAAASPIMDSAEYPDIYYIILDGYPSNKHLMRQWGYDNSAFTNALKERGFVVPEDSTSNYSVTLPSLASTLNMRFVTEDEVPVWDPTGETYGRTLIADNTVAQELQSRGYTYVFMLSGWDRPSTIADLNIDFYQDGPRWYRRGELLPNDRFTQESFLLALTHTTILGILPVDEWLSQQLAPPEKDRPLWFLSPQRARQTWLEVPKISAMPEATFTFAHIIKPHGPVIFNREGGVIPPPSDGDLKAYEPYFFAELEFVNEQTLTMIDEILAQSDVPPIIIIQGDHGSYLGLPGDLRGDKPYFEIMNAFYVPNGSRDAIYPSISSVNTFRILFNMTFNGDYELLPDDVHYFTIDRYANLFHFEKRDVLR